MPDARCPLSVVLSGVRWGCVSLVDVTGWRPSDGRGDRRPRGRGRAGRPWAMPDGGGGGGRRRAGEVAGSVAVDAVVHSGEERGPSPSTGRGPAAERVAAADAHFRPLECEKNRKVTPQSPLGVPSRIWNFVTSLSYFLAFQRSKKSSLNRCSM